MSDGQPTGTPTEDGPYVSQIDSLFAAAFNKVNDPNYGKPAEEGTGEGDPAPSGTQAPAAPDQGTPAEPPATGTPAEGTLPTAGDPGVGGDADDSGGTGDVQPTGTESPADGVSGVGTLAAKDAVAQFAPARKAAQERMEESFRRAAIAEIQADIDPEFVEILRQPSIRLVGNEVPSIRMGAPKGEKTKILDSTMAEQYQKGLARMVEAEVADLAAQKADAIKDTSRVINESFLLFENNPDLIIGTSEFDAELAALFVDAMKTYEVKVNGKVIGYQDVNPQPMLNSLRAMLAKQRGVSGAEAAAQRQAAQRAAAAAQPRQEDGKFDSPQGGIVSKSGMSGEPEEGYDVFWAATGVQRPGIGI